MSPVVDTTILIDWIRGVPSAVTYGEALSEAPVSSEVSRVEVLTGMRTGERDRTERFFGQIRWVAVNEAIARRAGELGRRYRRSHPGLGAPDLIVAATAEQLGLELATLNVRHFPMFRGLRPPYRD